MTPLRLIRALPEPKIGPLQVVGVDEWAFRKGRNYRTILVDMATRRPVDLLPEAASDALASWLARRPGIEVVCRDRYTESQPRAFAAAANSCAAAYSTRASSVPCRAAAHGHPPAGREQPEVDTDIGLAVFTRRGDYRAAGWLATYDRITDPEEDGRAEPAAPPRFRRGLGSPTEA